MKASFGKWKRHLTACVFGGISSRLSHLSTKWKLPLAACVRSKVKRLEAASTLVLLLLCLCAPVMAQAKVPIRTWLVGGTFGHKEMPNHPQDAHSANLYLMDLLFRTEYPADKELEASASYRDDLTVDAKGQKNTARWTKRMSKVSDNIVTARDDQTSGVCFFATWIKSPEDMVVTAHFPAYEPQFNGDIGMFGSTQMVWVNHVLIEHDQYSNHNGYHWHPKKNQQIFLKEGWNFIYGRVMGWWSVPRFGLVLEGESLKGKRIEVKAEPPLGFEKTLNLEKFPLLAGSPDQHGLNAMKNEALNTVVNAQGEVCTDTPQQGEPGVDIPLDEVGISFKVNNDNTQNLGAKE